MVGEILALRAAGRSLRAIARALADRGTTARNGQPFAAQTLAQVLRVIARLSTQAAGQEVE